MFKKNVLITGASRGIGRSTALRFAHEGYHVFLNCNTSIDALEDTKQTIDAHYPGCCTSVPADVGNPGAVRKMFDVIYNRCDSLDVLVNNAGISHIGLLMDMTDEEWNRVIRTNLSSVFYCCRAVVPKMVSKHSGNIVNISSMWGVSGASCEACYSASKAGVNGLTQALARELAPSNIRVNALACGVIDTVMNNQLSDDERRSLEYTIPMGRFGTPEEVADMVWNVVTAPAYMTGQIIGIDGGI